MSQFKDSQAERANPSSLCLLVLSGGLDRMRPVHVGEGNQLLLILPVNANLIRNTLPDTPQMRSGQISGHPAAQPS